MELRERRLGRTSALRLKVLTSICWDVKERISYRLMSGNLHGSTDSRLSLARVDLKVRLCLLKCVKTVFSVSCLGQMYEYIQKSFFRLTSTLQPDFETFESLIELSPSTMLLLECSGKCCSLNHPSQRRQSRSSRNNFHCHTEYKHSFLMTSKLLGS